MVLNSKFSDRVVRYDMRRDMASRGSQSRVRRDPVQRIRLERLVVNRIKNHG